MAEKRLPLQRRDRPRLSPGVPHPPPGRARVELDGLPEDRVDAAGVLDARLGDWRPLLERFAADRAPLHFRPRAETGALLRQLAADGVRIGVFTDAPRELAELALAHLGAARRVEAGGALHTG